MKKILFPAFAAVMAFASCSKEDNGARIPGTKTVEISINSGSTSRAAGTAINGVGTENDINAWVAFAQSSTDGLYVAAHASTSAGKATFTSVPVGSVVYVIANATPANLATALPADGATGISLATIEGIVENVVKTQLNTKSNLLNSTPGNPSVAQMLMTGSGVVLNSPMDNAAGETDKVKLTISLEREYAKVNFTARATPGTNVTAVGGTINSIDEISVHRVVNRVSPFKTQSAEWYIPKSPYVADASVNAGTPAAGASDLVFKYTQTGTGDKTQRFYTTPNYSALDAYATTVIVKATITANFGPDANFTNAERYYRAFVYDTDIAAEKGITLKNTIYNITAIINGPGEGTEEEALENDNVDLNIYVEAKYWNVRTTTVNME